MAKTKVKSDSKSGIFKRIFESNKELLKVPSIAAVVKQFEAQIGHAATASDRGLAANIKRKPRQKYGMRRRRRRKAGRPAEANGAVALATAQRVKPSTLARKHANAACI